jgi:hypothetical protein
MVKDNIYCGISSVPPNKKRGTMKQCLMKNQVRYYGKKKIDKSLLKMKDIGNPKNEKLKLVKLLAQLQGIKKNIDKEKNKKKKDTKKIEKLRKRGNKLLVEYKEQKKRYDKSIKYYEN